MANPSEPRREHPHTYMVQDRSSGEEFVRLRLQDELVTTGMGGVLPEQPDPATFKQILDVGCGTGGWLIRLAKEYPEVSSLTGIDVSKKMLDYAREQAREQGVDDRVKFYTMDALRMLEFPPNSFDLVNLRLAASYLRTWDWPNILQEFQRVSKPGATIRLTECDTLESNTPAFTAFYDFFVEAFNNAGHAFAPERDTVTKRLASFLHQSGVENVQTRAHVLEYKAGTFETTLLAEDVLHMSRTITPFLRKWTKLPPDYEAICQRALEEIQQPGFVATWRFLTAWGTVPVRKA